MLLISTLVSPYLDIIQDSTADPICFFIVILLGFGTHEKFTNAYQKPSLAKLPRETNQNPGLCNTFCGQIKGILRYIYLILPCGQGIIL